MRKINLFLVCGNMLTGKTTLINEIKKQNEKYNDGILILDEQNFYKNFLNKRKTTKGKENNFHFEVQTFLLNNFMQEFRKKVVDFTFEQKEKMEIDIVLDTFPLITGNIFSNCKFNSGLINADEMTLLKSKYKISEEIFQHLVKTIVDANVEISIITFFRTIDKNLALAFLKKRSLKEYRFYTENIIYYDNLHKDLSDYIVYNENLFNIFGGQVFNFDFVKQKIENEEDFNLNNQKIFSKIYGV